MRAYAPGTLDTASVAPDVSVQRGLDHTADLYFSTMSFCLAADDLVYTDLNL